MRHDIHGKDGLNPSRSSASTLTTSSTTSSSLGSLGPRPSGHGAGTGGLQLDQEQEVCDKTHGPRKSLSLST